MAEDNENYEGFIPGYRFYDFARWVFKLQNAGRYDEADKLIATLKAADLSELDALKLPARKRQQRAHTIEEFYRKIFSASSRTPDVERKINKNVHRFLLNAKAHIDSDVAEEAKRIYDRLKDHKENISKQNPDAAQKWWENQIDLYHYLAKPLDEVDDGGSL